MMSASSISVRVIGAGEIVVGRLKVRPDATVLFALLLYLSVRAGARVSRAELLELLWSGIPDAARKHSLRQIVYRVRRAGLELDDGNDLTIERQIVDSDLNRLLTEEWVATVPLRDLPAATGILSACNGSLTPAFAEWIDSVRQNAESHVRRAALRHIARARREGRWVDVDHVARRCLTTDPLNEEATLAFAEAMAMSGSKAEALRVLDAYLWEIGDKVKEIGLPAKLLRRRISDQPDSRTPRAGEVPLIGRETDLAWLNDQIEASVNRPPSALLVGPPGIGKTAIVRAFAGQTEMRGWRVPQARLQPSDVTRPMSLFVELLPNLLSMEGAAGASPESMTLIRQLLHHDDPGGADTVRMLDAPAFPARVSAAIVDLVTAVAHEGPLVVVLEDLHWIDAQSLRSLTWLTEQTPPAPVFVVMTARPENQFATLNEARSPDHGVTRQVSALDADASATLLIALAPAAGQPENAEVVANAYALTGGNPLFIRGVAAHWNKSGSVAGLPPSLRELIRARVSHFSASAQRVLHTCAMLGRYASIKRVSAILEAPGAVLLNSVEELDSLGLVGLSDEPGSLALHDLWQEELLAGLRPASRALLHLRCGEVLESEAAETRSAGFVHDAARHLIAAGVSERAITLLEEAARYQLANGFTEAAVETSRRALAASVQTDARDRLRALHLQALQAIGDWVGIIQICSDTAGQIRERGKHDGGHSNEESLVIEALWRTGTAPQRAIEAALRCAEDSTASVAHRLAACLVTAQAASNLFDSESLTRAHQALRLLPVSADGPTATEMAAHVVLETETGSLDRAAEWADRLIALERTRGSKLALARALRFAAYPRRALGDWGLALAFGAESFALATRHQLHEQAAHAACLHATIQFESGQVSDVDAWIDRADFWSKKTGLEHLRRGALTLRVGAALRNGDTDSAGRLLANITIDAEPATEREPLEILALKAEHCMAKQEWELLIPIVESLAERLGRSRTHVRQDWYVVTYVEALRALNRKGEATAFASEYLSTWRRDVSPAPGKLRSS